MGILKNLTLDSSQPEITHWESTPDLSSAVNNAVIVLGVLTFALQLCLVLYFVLRCWRFDNRVQQALKQPDAVKKLIAPSTFHIDIYKQMSYQEVDAPATSLTAASTSVDDYKSSTNSVFATSIPWDLVQR